MTLCDRRNLVLGLLIVTMGLVPPSGCIKKIDEKTSTAAKTDSVVVSEPVDSLVLVMDGAESQTVLDVLQNAHQVELKPSAMGAFVVAIDSIIGGGDAFWMYSVNGEMGQVACDRFQTRPGDTVRWHFRLMAR